MQALPGPSSVDVPSESDEPLEWSHLMCVSVDKERPEGGPMLFELSESQKAIQASASALAQSTFVNDWKAWEDPDVDKHELHRTSRTALAELGLLGIRVPSELGGGGGQVIDLVLAIEAIAKVSPYTAHILSATAGNQVQPLVRFASEQLRERILPRVLDGSMSGAVAISEADGGSNVGAMKTRAVRSADGTWSVTGRKAYISDGDVADYYIVATRDPDVSGLAGVGLMLVERDREGVSVGRVDIRATGGREAEIVFDDVNVPDENVLLSTGEFKEFLLLHNAQRCGNAAVSLGIAQAAFESARDFALDRHVSGGRLADMQGIRWEFADMLMRLESARMMLYRAASSYAVDRRETPLECFLAKLTCNEAAVDVTSEAMQIFGCSGLSTDLPMESRWRYAKGQGVAGGTTQILRNGIGKQIFDKRVVPSMTPQ